MVFWSLRVNERHRNLYWHKLSTEFVPEGFMRLVMRMESIWSVNPYSRRKQYKHDIWWQLCINYETILRYTLALVRSFFFTTALIRRYFLRVNRLKTTRWSYNTSIQEKRLKLVKCRKQDQVRDEIIVLFIAATIFKFFTRKFHTSNIFFPLAHFN